MSNKKNYAIMKTIYLVKSFNQDEFLIFGTMKRAENWIKEKFNKEIFDKSNPCDLYIIKRMVL